MNGALACVASERVAGIEVEGLRHLVNQPSGSSGTSNVS